MSAVEDFDRLRAVTRTADEQMANAADADGKKTGVHSDAIKAVAVMRTRFVLAHFGQLPRVLTDKQLRDVEREMTTMWMDGFAIGRLSAFQDTEEPRP